MHKTAARFLTCSKHISWEPAALHLLCQFKTLYFSFVFQAPSYLPNLLIPYIPPRSLKSPAHSFWSSMLSLQLAPVSPTAPQLHHSVTENLRPKWIYNSLRFKFDFQPSKLKSSRKGREMEWQMDRKSSALSIWCSAECVAGQADSSLSI